MLSLQPWLYLLCRVCPDELKEAISTLIYASSRCGDFPELLEIRSVFQSHFGKEFVACSTELRNNCAVNTKVYVTLRFVYWYIMYVLSVTTRSVTQWFSCLKLTLMCFGKFKVGILLKSMLQVRISCAEGSLDLDFSEHCLLLLLMMVIRWLSSTRAGCLIRLIPKIGRFTVVTWSPMVFKRNGSPVFAYTLHFRSSADDSEDVDSPSWLGEQNQVA